MRRTIDFADDTGIRAAKSLHFAFRIRRGFFFIAPGGGGYWSFSTLGVRYVCRLNLNFFFFFSSWCRCNRTNRKNLENWAEKCDFWRENFLVFLVLNRSFLTEIFSSSTKISPACLVALWMPQKGASQAKASVSYLNNSKRFDLTQVVPIYNQVCVILTNQYIKLTLSQRTNLKSS